MKDREDVLAVCWFAHRPGPITAGSVNRILRHERDDPEADFEPVLHQLVDEGVLEPVDDGWVLTDAGRDEAHREGTRMMGEGFDRELLKHEASAAYREYCRRVYASDLFQFNMVDGPQRAALLEVLALSEGERFADIGCALGSMTAWIAEQTGATGLGIDLAPRCIAEANRRAEADLRLEFRVGNLDSLDLPELDAVVFIDTLYFCRDLAETVRVAVDALKPGGRFVAFFTAKKGRDEGLEVHEIRVGKALIAAGLEPRGIDFTAEGRGVWERALAACSDLQEAFEAEGNDKLHAARTEEARNQLDKYEQGISRRWLVWARVDS